MPWLHTMLHVCVTMAHYGLSMSFHSLDTLVPSDPGPSL